MIRNWRRDWSNDQLPLIYVQLPNFKAPQQQPVETDGWVIVQEQMLKALAEPHMGMAVTIDVGEAMGLTALAFDPARVGFTWRGR